MGSQTCSPLDASTRTRVLTPSSESALSLNDAPLGGTRKRKWDGDTMEELLDDVFVLKPHLSTIFSKPQKLWPIALLPRSHLPLSCLDMTPGGGALAVSRLFEAHVKVLELEHRLGSAPMVLIARSEDGKSYFAIERESRDLYAVCRLGSWVRINQLCMAAVVSRHHLENETRNDVGRPPSAKGIIEEPVITTEASKYSKKKRLAIEAIQSMVKRPSRDISAISENAAVLQPHSKMDMEPQLQESGDVTGVQGEILAQPAATDILENIRSQYFEALYISKASLAYFAKGPLSRARAAFHLDYDSLLDMNDLIAFLKSLVLPTSVVDKKYKDAVPNLVSTLIVGSGSADEAQKVASKPKKAKIKKTKLGKNGLYPTEDTYITRWWNSHDASADPAVPGETKDEILRKRISQLRIRETQLQMILILETLALQPLATPQVNHDENLPVPSIESGISDGKRVQTGKPKKSLDLAVLVEVLVDRLCIWQSVAAETGIAVSKTEGESKISATSGGISEKHDNAADMLREFCVEVIVPFFSARLPEQCGAISRKLGGPVVVSPVRPKQIQSSTSSGAKPRPGAVTRRPVPSKVRKSLQRVLTDERHQRSASRGPSGAISLMRSATAPAAPGLKRESSESPLLESIPCSESQSLAVSRRGVLKTKKFSQREVDLSSIAPGNDTKSKKSNIEAELKEAISALKRPNRQLAGQLMVETAERRTASASMNCRKLKKPARKPSFQSVQILSTPKGNRRKDVSLNTPPTIGLSVGQNDEVEAVPHSSLPRIPLSVNRSTNARSYEARPQFQATPARILHEAKPGTAIQVTPCRSGPGFTSRLSGGFKAWSSQNHDGVDLDSPQARHSNETKLCDLLVPSIQAIECTPVKGFAVQATPIKPAKSQIRDEGTFSKLATQSSQATEVENVKRQNDDGPQSSIRGGSIYETLGWDDYDDLA